ncbi:MAG TPA: spermidine/putrescine ABC transporter permease [Actinobacteria bacterium]|nr:spermidine/putrescine ABC transporter permease [Actinomycetota bacterium]HCK79139.1 spermidine/putrescine ABC transporter permease [Actinomycetota bacterium]
MRISRSTRIVAGLFVAAALAFVYVPLVVVVINSFNASNVFSWPPREFTTKWWRAAWINVGAREAVVTSVQVATIATVLALILGTLLAFALSRHRFWGQRTLSLLVVLPIALPGIVTALALRTAFRSVVGVELSIWTVAIAHATFCIVVVYNNAAARLSRMGTSPEEASADLGAGMFTTFRLVTLPMMRGALLAGAILAFGLSFDEIVVTLFTSPPGVTTLPIWIFQNLFRPNQAPIVNVVAAVLVVVSIVPIWLSQRLSGETTTGGRI